MNRRALWALPIVAVGTCSLSVWAADPSAVGGLGLIEALPFSFFVGMALLLVGVVLGIAREAEAAAWRWVHLAALAVFLHGLPGLVESNPRFPTAWLHAAFADHVARHGTLLTGLDTRFSWGGFFAGSALLERSAGTESLHWLLRFTPLAVNIFACSAILLLGRAVGLEAAQSFFAASLYLLLNWSGQDYFSPQATAFCLYLAVIVVTFALFAGPGPRPGSLGDRLLRPARLPVRQLSRRVSILSLLGLLLVGSAVVVSHQLTPAFLAAALVLAGVLRVTRLRALGFAIAMGAFAWFSLAAQPFWTGHLSDVTGSAGQVLSILQENVTARSAGANLDRRLGLYARSGIALAAWTVAGVAVVVARRKGKTPVGLAALFIAPFPVLLAQPYGGEVIIRVFLFTLPPAVLLISHFALPDRLRGERRAPKWAYGALLLLVPVFLVARFGNEAFERVSDHDLELVSTLNSMAPDSSVVFVVNAHTITHSDRVGKIRYQVVDESTAGEILERIDEDTRGNGPEFILLTESQEAYGVVALGRPAGWLSTLAGELSATGRVVTVARAGRSVLFKLRS